MATILATNIREKALSLGFPFVGIIPARPAKRLDAYLSWISLEYQGQMGYLARPDRISRRRDLNVILPGVQTIICIGLDYFSERIPVHIANDPSRGRISNYAWGEDYHNIILENLERMNQWLNQVSGSDVKSKIYVDTGALLERDHAESAGLGFTGKNTMIINPKRGSWIFLGEILTSAEVIHDDLNLRSRKQMPHCGKCDRCLHACPTHAFPEPYILDARRCISYLTIELKEWIPIEIRPLMGNWIYGCDVCQDVCPFNRFSKPSKESRFWPDFRINASQEFTNEFLDMVAPPLPSLLMMDEATFYKRFASSPIKRIKRHRFLRNACIAAGNWGNPIAVSGLTHLLSDPEPILRGHAAWALGQIGGENSFSVLSDALIGEDQELVRAEINLAMEELKL